MKKRLIAIVASCAMVACFALAGCAGGGGDVAYEDGTYTGQSEVYEDTEDENANGYGVATITITDGAISDAEFTTYEPDGTLKDADYGKTSGGITNQDFYNKAQKAVAACDEYAAQLVATGHADAVDVISGATINYDEFQEAVDEALAQAAK